MVLAANLAAVGLTAAGCGDDAVLRPLSIDIQGLSSRAQVLVVQLIPGPSAPTCAQVNATNVTSLNAPIRLVWSRSSDEERRLVAPDLAATRVTVVAHSEDAIGTLLQMGCRVVDYLDIESPEVEIPLASIES